MRRTLGTIVVLLLALTSIAACGGQSDSPVTGGGTSGPAPSPKTVKVTIKGDSVTPNGERVQVATGQEVDLKITADAAGEIHVHSSPEQELHYPSGTSTQTIEGIGTPGTVDVESHTLDKVIVQLEVR